MRQTTILKTLTMTVMMMTATPTWAQDALLDGYVQQMIDASLPAAKRSVTANTRSASAYLTGNDARVYNLLAPVMRDIAAGKILHTRISVSPEDIYGGKCEFTAADLGVAALIVNKKISQDAIDALYAKIHFDLKTVMNALLADMPYEFYWYDKVTGWGYTGPTCSTDGKTIHFIDEGECYFTVSKDYSATGKVETYDVKKGIVDVAEKALKNASAIVEANKGKALLPMITAFKEAICERASYNTEAWMDENTPYGNLWQMIWVFDEDPATKVVCEGYSKAFKYLCDMSDLGAVAECRLMSGKMVTETIGPHMWNVMKMDDGLNYLIDVTNCDEGMAGYPDLLFLACDPTGTAEQYTIHEIPMMYIYDSGTQSTFPEEDRILSTTPYATTGIKDVRSEGVKGDNWYDLNGRRLNGQPTKKGLYIRNGKKTIIR